MAGEPCHQLIDEFFRAEGAEALKLAVDVTQSGCGALFDEAALPKKLRARLKTLPLSDEDGLKGTLILLRLCRLARPALELMAVVTNGAYPAHVRAEAIESLPIAMHPIRLRLSDRMALRAALADPNVEVRRAACYTLGALGNRRDVALLLRAANLAGASSDAETEAMAHQSVFELRARLAGKWFDTIPPAGDRGIARTLAASRDPYLRIFGIQQLANVGGPEDIAFLKSLLLNDLAIPGVGMVREEAAKALRRVSRREDISGMVTVLGDIESPIDAKWNANEN